MATHDDPSDLVTEETKEAEAADAGAEHRPDPAAGDAQPGDDDVDPEVREHFEEMNRIGAEDKGEGRIP